jgi:hypothetical protein
MSAKLMNCFRLLRFFLETRRLRRCYAGQPALLIPAMGEAVEHFCGART